MRKLFAAAILAAACMTVPVFAENTADTENLQASETITEENTEDGETGLALDEAINIYSGKWSEEIAGRGYMEIEPSGNGQYYVTVTWSSSAAEKALWTFTAIYDRETGSLVYDDGRFQNIRFNEDDSEEVLEEKSVKGVLDFKDGKIFWTDSADGSDKPSVFISEASAEEEDTDNAALE